MKTKQDVAALIQSAKALTNDSTKINDAAVTKLLDDFNLYEEEFLSSPELIEEHGLDLMAAYGAIKDLLERINQGAWTSL